MDEVEIQKMKDEHEAKVTELEKLVAEKDVLISQKNDDLVGQRKHYKKLADMTQEDKDSLSQKELELQERQEAMEAEQEKFQNEQLEVQGREVKARLDAAIKKHVGDNDEFATKLRANFELIKDSENAVTEEEVSGLMSTAYNMLGEEKPSPVDATIGTSGGAPGDSSTGGFADTPEGQGLAGTLGLTTPEAPKTD